MEREDQSIEAGTQQSEGRAQLAAPLERRSFLGLLFGVGSVGVTALISIGVASISALLSVPIVRFMLHPLSAKTTETAWSEIGAAEEFSAITIPVKRLMTVEQRDGWRKVISEKSVYVTKGKDGQLRVLSAICTHLGCSVPWIEAKGQFICPCHNGVFAPDGALISGPPPRGLDELETKIEGGRLLVRYQYFRQLVPTKEVIA